jgi:hypothetical protein
MKEISMFEKVAINLNEGGPFTRFLIENIAKAFCILINNVLGRL